MEGGRPPDTREIGASWASRRIARERGIWNQDGCHIAIS